MNRVKPQHVILIGALVLVGAFVVPMVVSDPPGATSTSGGTITKSFGASSANASVSYPVQLLEGSDAEHESIHMFEALAGLPGLGKVSLDTATLQLTVEYDENAVGETEIRKRLVSSRYVAPSRDDAKQAELAEDGSVQRVSVTDYGHGFDPALIVLTAGVPTEIEFGPGQECRTSVKFPQLGLEQDISQGGMVALPALEAGQYQIVCSGDAEEGILIVE